jgi:hypothetical protein
MLTYDPDETFMLFEGSAFYIPFSARSDDTFVSLSDKFLSRNFLPRNLSGIPTETVVSLKKNLLKCRRVLIAK